MDTNYVAQLLERVAELQTAVQNTNSNAVTITQIILLALAPVTLAFAAWLNSRAVYKVVNSERATMLAERSALLAENKELREIKGLDELRTLKELLEVSRHLESQTSATDKTAANLPFDTVPPKE